ncbi:MAG: twin-arginine translocation signal domain-containing protein [Armatimonadota bacterium]
MTQISRRELIKGAAAGALAAGLVGSEALAAQQEAKARVVVVTCTDVIDRNKPLNAGALRRMMERGITALARKRDVAEAWKTFIRPSDEVALVDAGTWLFNVPEVLAEVMRGITMASPKFAKLTYCAYDERNQQWMVQLRSALKSAGIPETVMDGSVYTVRSNGFHRSRFTSLVMAPTLKSSNIAGVSGVVKHYATMSKGGPAPHHPNAMETAGSVIVPEFGHMKHLIIVDALRFGETTRGPQYYQKSLIFSTDPVAADVIALDLYLRNCKTFGDLPPDRHRTLADTRYKAGISDRKRIDVQEITV